MKEPKRISLATFIVTLLVMLAICVMLIYMIVSDKNKDNKEENTNEASNSAVVNSQNSGNKDINNSSSDENKLLTEKEARAILNQKYEVLMKLYVSSDEYFKINNEAVKYDEYTLIHLIENYDEVVNKYLSNNMKKVFEENAICLIKYEGKYWLAEGGGGFSTYGGVEEIKDISVTNVKISAIVKTKHYDIDENFTGYKESKFILVKEGNDWLIDEFDFSVLY